MRLATYFLSGCFTENLLEKAVLHKLSLDVVMSTVTVKVGCHIAIHSLFSLVRVADDHSHL